MRASLGRTEPFELKYIEIGNEVGDTVFCVNTYLTGAYRTLGTALRAIIQLKPNFADLSTFTATYTDGETSMAILLKSFHNYVS